MPGVLGETRPGTGTGPTNGFDATICCRKRFRIVTGYEFRDLSRISQPVSFFFWPL